MSVWERENKGLWEDREIEKIMKHRKGRDISGAKILPINEEKNILPSRNDEKN